MSKLLAFDLGAESGRAIVGHFDGERLALEELHRFANGPVQVFDRLYWDPLRLFAEMKQGLGLFAHTHGKALDAIGVDTWGVDFALLGPGDVLLDNPRNYRDPRTDGMLEEAFARVPREEIFARTGVQFLKLNTLYQLLSLRDSPLLEWAQTFLMMADLFNFYFTGTKTCEFSNATTTQFYDPRQGTWSVELLEGLGLPTHFLPSIVQPGTRLGSLLPSIAAETGLGSVPVIAPATHDTGAAVAAVPAEVRDYAYISSGTWSLMGVELDQPLIKRSGIPVQFHQRRGRRADLPLPQKHHGAVANTGMPARVAARGACLFLRRADGHGPKRNALYRFRRSRRRVLSRAGRHARQNPRLLPRNGPSHSRRRGPSRARGSRKP